MNADKAWMPQRCAPAWLLPPPALQQAVQVVASVPMPPLTVGQRLRFNLRLVPTIRLC